MIAIATVLVAFPAGFFLRRRIEAFVVYIAVFAYCFTAQGMYLLPQFTADAGPGEWPRDPDKFPVSYLLVSAAIYAIGFGLVLLGHRVGRGRRLRRAQEPEVMVPSPAGTPSGSHRT